MIALIMNIIKHYRALLFLNKQHISWPIIEGPRFIWRATYSLISMSHTCVPFVAYSPKREWYGSNMAVYNFQVRKKRQNIGVFRAQFSHWETLKVYPDIDSWTLSRAWRITRLLPVRGPAGDYGSLCLISEHLPADLWAKSASANCFCSSGSRVAYVCGMHFN